MTLDQCMETISICHQRVPHDGAQSCHSVGTHSINVYLDQVGDEVADRQKAITDLLMKFDNKFPGEDDPALLRDYIKTIAAQLQSETDDAT